MPRHPCLLHPALVRHHPNCRNEGCVHGELDPAKQWQAVGNNLEPPVIVGIGHSKIQISDELVSGHPCPGLSADPPSGAFQSEPSSSEHPTPRARCTVVAKSVEWTVTPEGTFGKGQREGKTPLKQHPEQSGLYPCQREEGVEDSGTPATAFNSAGCFVLPTSSLAPRFKLLGLPRWRTETSCHALHCGSSKSSTPSRSCAARLAVPRQRDAVSFVGFL